MNEFEFADKHLGEYKVKGNEINIKYCPYCSGGPHGDKYKFFLNTVNHTFICHRGSCGARGTFNELCKEFGERAEYVMEMKRERFDKVALKQAKEYKKPTMELKDISKQAAEYLKLRKLSDETMKHFNVKSDNNGNIVLPFYDENKNHVLNKIRLPRKFIKCKDNTKIWQEGAGKPILFGMDKANTNLPLMITEGEMDCMSVYEAGFKNVVSIPFGTENMEWINECWNWLNKCKDIILWFDSDEAGEKALEAVSKKIGIEKCKKVICDDKDANIVLFNYGKNKILNCIKNAEYFPIENLCCASEITKEKRERILYGNKFLDYKLGGCGMGELVIWTGKRGSGKSTHLTQTIIETIEQKTKCFLYSGELRNSRTIQWLNRQIAGERYIITEKDELTGREEYSVHPEIEKILEEWYKDYLFIYGDNGKKDIEDLLLIMERAYKRYDVKRFIMDNLKVLHCEKGENFYRQQAFIVNKLKDFARKYNVHVDLVVHPRKTSNDELSDEDVGGSVDIIDLADNVIGVSKITDTLKEKAKEDNINQTEKELLINNDSMLYIRKNREYGDVDGKAYLKFNPKSKRYYGKNGFETYSWENKVKDRNIVLNKSFEKPMEDNCPF